MDRARKDVAEFYKYSGLTAISARERPYCTSGASLILGVVPCTESCSRSVSPVLALQRRADTIPLGNSSRAGNVRVGGVRLEASLASGVCGEGRVDACRVRETLIFGGTLLCVQ